MEGETSPQPSAFKEARKIALEKGAERRQRASRRIGSLFGGIKEKITKAVDFIGGSPDAAAFLGKRAVQLGKEKAEETRDAVVEAGVRTWERIVDAKDRLIQRATDAKDRLVARYEQTRDATKVKITELSKRAAIWGLTKIAEPIEDRLQRVYEIPADIREWQAKRADIKAQKQETRAQLVKERGEARVQALQAEIARIQEATVAQIEGLSASRDAALAKSQELYDKAAVRREQAVNNFGKARAIVAALEAK